MLPTRSPYPTVDDQPFWDALPEGRVHLPRCLACDYVIWYPRHHCPNCGAGPERIDWFDASGRGTIYSYSIVRRNRGAWGEVLPYVVAYVELEEGPRVITNIVVDPADVDSIAIGLPVHAVFDPVPTSASDSAGAGAGAGAALLRFALS